MEKWLHSLVSPGALQLTWGVIVNTTIIYLFLIVLLRIAGRRTLAQLSSMDLVVVILLGSAVETSMVQASTVLRFGFVSGGVIFLLNFVITQAMGKSRKVRHLLGGGPILLAHNGKLNENSIRRSGLTLEDVRASLRNREVADLDEVRYAVLETDGRITVVTRNAPDSSTPTSIGTTG